VMRPAKLKFKAKRDAKRVGLVMQPRTRENNIISQKDGAQIIRSGNGTLSSTEKARLFPSRTSGRGTISRAAAKQRRLAR